MCSYHGWRFNDCGKCVKIPQADDEKSHEAACSNQRSAVTTFPCKVSLSVVNSHDILSSVEARGGFLWIWPDSSEDAFKESATKTDSLPDDIAEYLDRAASEGDRNGSVRILPYDYEILVENLVDPAHFPFAHHGSYPYLKRSNGGAVSMTSVTPVFRNAIASVEFKESALGVTRTSRLEFVDPALNVLIFESKDPVKSDAYGFSLLSPVKNGASRVLSTLISEGQLSGHTPKSPSFHLFMPFRLHTTRNLILDGSNVFLHIQEKNLRKQRKSGWTADTYFTPTSADYMVLRFRNWLKKEGGGGPFGPSDIQETSPMSRRELLDRYESYTLQTKDAQKMLAFVNRSIATFKMLSNVFLLMGGATVVYSMQKGVVFMWQTLVCLSAFALCLFLQHFVRSKILPLFHFMDYVHADKN